MTAINEHYALGVCKVCKVEFTYYKAEGKRWCCSPEHESRRKAVARQAAQRWKPQKKREEAGNEQ